MQKGKNDDATQGVTPSQKAMTAGQIDKAVQNYRVLLEKHAHEFESNAIQTVFGDPEFAAEQYSVLRKRVEVTSSMITKTVKVNRNQTPKEVLNATGRTQYVNDSVVQEMPRGEGEEVNVVFFKVGRQISDDDLEKEYELRGLVPADTYSQSKVNEDYPGFADTHPNGTHWKNKKGQWCCSSFDGWGGERRMDVYQSDRGWCDDWWFAGLRKSELKTKI